MVRVFPDGKAVISSATTAYPAGPGQVTFFENRIGSSTADTNFTWIVHFLQRMGPRPAFPWNAKRAQSAFSLSRIVRIAS